MTQPSFPQGTQSADNELDSLSVNLSKSIVANSKRLSSIIDCAITLLESFKFQADKFKKLGYCDGQVAYVCFKTCRSLIEMCEGVKGTEMKELIGLVLVTLKSYDSSLLSILANMGNSSGDKGAEDPLLGRLSKLKLGHVNPKAELGYENSDFISPLSLNNLIRDTSRKVLIIDFRTRKEFSYSHLNFANVVNIEPSLVATIIAGNPEATDDDLEIGITKTMEPAMLRLFRERHRFDRVILYNLRFGGDSSDRFKSLEHLLINGNNVGIASASPFRDLINLLMFRTKYISSRLRKYPSILAGGLEGWYHTFGEAGLTSTSAALEVYSSGDSRKRSEVSQNIVRASQDTSNYLRNFGDYLASGSRSDETSLRTAMNPKVSYNRASNGAVLISEHSGAATPRSWKGSDVEQKSRPPSSKLEKSVVERSVSHNELVFLESFATGLTNLGNSCYMNCILQCLGATPQLTGFFFAVDTSRDKVVKAYEKHINSTNLLGSKGVITSSFVQLLQEMFSNSGKYFTPSTFKLVVGKLSPAQQFANFDQQDCIEFLNFILDSLHEDLNQRTVLTSEERVAIMELSPEQEQARELMPVRLASTIEWERYLKINFSVIVDYFQGQYLSQLKCLECLLTSTSYNAFSILSLPIPEKLSGSNKVLLTECLELFTETELLDDNNKWHCPNCRRFTKLTKKITISRLPRVLIIHFKRFSMDERGNFKKLETLIEYPVNKTLDLTSYWPQVGSYAVQYPANQIGVEKEREILASFPDRHQDMPFRYELYGVVNHFGNLTTGHYTSFVKKASRNKSRKDWCYFDDAKVLYNCAENQVLNRSAYCLFFQRI